MNIALQEAGKKKSFNPERSLLSEKSTEKTGAGLFLVLFFFCVCSAVFCPGEISGTAKQKAEEL